MELVMKTTAIDLTESSVNIDSLLDVYVETQKANGVDPGFEESVIEVTSSGSFVKVKSDEPSRDEPKQKETPCKKCGGGESCGNECKEEKSDKYKLPEYMVNKMGLFDNDMSPEIYDGEEDDDAYICEYCTELGYRKEYKSYICDMCRVCETCPEFENDECSGCTFSSYRTGQLYSDVLRNSGDNSYLEDDEKEIIDGIKGDAFKDSDVRKPDTSFTILDYDHKY